MARRKWPFSVVALIALALMLFVAAGPQVVAQTATTAAPPAQQSAVQVVQNVGPAVVTVINEQQVSGPFGLGGNQVQPAGSGSGFIIDNQGHVVTNNHVVAGGSKFVVIYADGTKKDAKLIGADPTSDLAVVQVSGTVPGTVTLGDSSQLKVGQTVLALGSPLGAFTNTVTEGIVSALGRSLLNSTQATGSQALYTNLIQHDAPINPGNSGGPLVDLSGQVIGVNTIGIPQAEQGVPAQGLFFAIPSNTVKEIAQQLIANGKVTYAFLGIQNPTSLDPILAAQNDLPVDYGIYIGGVVPGGPAAQAGLQANDIMISVDGKKLGTEISLEQVLIANNPGSTIQVTVQRGNQQKQVSLKLGSRPQQG